MATIIRFLLFAIILYFILTWLRSYFLPKRKESNKGSNVRIFKEGDLEKPTVNIKDAETVEFEELEK